MVAEPVVIEKPKEAAPVINVKIPTEVIEKPVVATVIETLEDDEVKKINTKFETLSGPKVLGKINLPTVAPTGVKSLAGEARDELREKRKRKRKQAGTEKVAVQESVQIAARNSTPDANRPAPKAAITKEAVQQKCGTPWGKWEMLVKHAA